MAGSESKKVILAALVGNSAISITKFIAAAMTGSAAMFSEGVHSLVDTGNQVLLLYGLKRSNKPADEQHPFGYGKEIYFWSFIVAILIFAVGGGIVFYEGVHAILHPKPVSNPMVNYVVLSLAIVFEGFAWYYAYKAFKKSKGSWSYIEAVQKGKDPSLFVVLFEDTAAMLGLVIALVGVSLVQLTGNPIWDGISSVLIALILFATAVWLAIETKGLLIGEGANPRVVRGIREIVNSHDEVEAVSELLTIYIGPEYLLVNISIDFRNDLSVGQIEKTISLIDEALKTEYKQIGKVFVEAEALTKAL